MAYLLAQADAARLPLADRSIDLCIGSPPYVDARAYLEDGVDLGISRSTDAWISWMLAVTAEALRVSRNCVIWIAAGVTRDRNYQSACEGLIDCWRRRKVPSGVWQDGIELPGCAGSMYRPVYWHRVGIPGSGHDDWFRADVEMCMIFKRPGRIPYSDNTACGHPPKWAPGGEMSHRLKDGERRNQWGGHENNGASSRKRDGSFQDYGRPSHRYLKRMKGSVHEGSGDAEVQGYSAPALANPGNFLETEEDMTWEDWVGHVLRSVLYTTVGGGQMGWDGAHENEAPMPSKVPEFFIKSLTKPGDIVFDPFDGSGTSIRAAEAMGRHGIGFDLRRSQCDLARRGLERPHQKVVKQSKKSAGKSAPLFDRITD